MLESEGFTPARWCFEYRSSQKKVDTSKLPEDRISLACQIGFELYSELMGVRRFRSGKKLDTSKVRRKKEM